MSDLERLRRRSVEVIRAGQAPTGAYLAAPTFPPYRFSWFRDGAFIADAMSRAEETDSAEAFFDWAAQIVLDRREAIERGEHPHTRYTADGRESDIEWPHFQLDGYGLLLWAVAGHAERHGADLERWREAVDVVADYLGRSWLLSCTDWWEEQEGLHAATVGSIAAGLRAVAHPAAAEVEAGLAEADWRVDASLVALATPLDVVPPEGIALEELDRALLAPTGGVHRHPADTYYGGGEWVLLTALRGWHLARVGRRDEAEQALAWVTTQMRPDGALPEQVDGHLLAPGRRDAWVAKWGEPACPLLWSHAMALDLLLALER